nr:glycosyltransferase family 2 protein [uncultured Carboxylicivirga sp.]
MKKPYISIIIPVKNGIHTIHHCLNGISKQTLFSQSEIIVIDSGSTDGTLEILRQYPVKVVTIPPEEFNHGATRNYGVSIANGELVVMTVQDAKPVNEYWLENMARHFKDPAVAGVCGQQVVPHHKNNNPHRWFRPQSEASIKTVQFTKDSFLKLSPYEQKEACGWDDVTAMYRKKILLEIPFKPVMFGEDMIWAKETLSLGYTLVYDTNARVEHHHHHYPDYTFRRVQVVWLFIYLTFGYIRSNPYTIRDYFLIVYRNIKWKAHPKWIIHNWSLIYYSSKAIKDFNKIVKQNKISELENKLAINIPQGKTSN